MSQVNQVVETTPGQSQKVLKTSETVNLTEKSKGSQQGHKMQHNDGKRLFSGFLISFASGVVQRNCWMKQQANRHIQGHLWLSKLAVWVLCTENGA